MEKVFSCTGQKTKHVLVNDPVFKALLPFYVIKLNGVTRIISIV